MAGTHIGGKNAADTNYLRHGNDFYERIGALGGAASKGGGFGSSKIGADGLTGRERARIVGAKGGKKAKPSWTPERRAAQSERTISWWEKRRANARPI